MSTEADERGRGASERETSAGGVVVRDGSDGPEVVVIVPTRRGAQGEKVLALPKGHPEAGESLEQAAEREVREETGVRGALVAPLGDVRYWYSRGGRRIAKRVAFYLFTYKAGRLDEHDHEVEDARWVPLEEAERELSYPGEREMVALARSRLGDGR